MFQALLGVFLLLACALLILLNSSYTTTFNLFGKVYQQVPIIVVVLVSFFTGVCYVFLLYLYGKLRQWGKNRRNQKIATLEATARDQKKEDTPSG